MPAELLMVSRFPTKPGTAEALASVLEGAVDGRVFVGLESDEVLAVEVVSSDLDLAGVRERFADVARDFAQYLSGDIRREILDFVEAPKSCAGPLPETPYLQLRHVEVKPEEYFAYRSWRDETIFDVVRTAPEVEVFLAYHSLISTQPGVMFLSGFSVDPETYGAVFASERYRDIVQQAGDQYITGGTAGLYTKVYANTALRAA